MPSGCLLLQLVSYVLSPRMALPLSMATAIAVRKAEVEGMAHALVLHARYCQANLLDLAIQVPSGLWPAAAE